ncbi:MAG: DUF4397 domain-containing protein [Chitinophagaceae bacterium]|nr:DUF4397 domain-containing protein [Chitinophagaceae bacterium]
MRISKIKYLVACCGAMVLLAGACQKKVMVTSTPDSQISFYNVSEYIQIQTLNTSGQSFLFIDAKDTTHSGVTVPVSNTPSFGSGEYQFPNYFYYTRQTLPWISYMRVHPGEHSITLTDTGGHHPLITSAVTTVPGSPVSVYYADSLGHFRSWVLTDTVTESAGAVRLRVIDLSPDVGNVFFTIGGQPAAGFPDHQQYGQISPFVAWPNPVADTLQIRFYNTRDSVDVVASGSLSVTPGHAYNVVLTGYTNSQAFPDPVTGRYLNFNPDLKVLLTQNN